MVKTFKDNLIQANYRAGIGDALGENNGYSGESKGGSEAAEAVAQSKKSAALVSAFASYKNIYSKWDATTNSRLLRPTIATTCAIAEKQ